VNHPPILLGTSFFTASGWDGVFYPKGMRSADYLIFYAEHFHTVEASRADDPHHSRFLGESLLQHGVPRGYPSAAHVRYVVQISLGLAPEDRSAAISGQNGQAVRLG